MQDEDDNWDVQRSKKNDDGEDVPINYWEISNNGKATFNYITANKSGEIAGWTISKDTLTGKTKDGNRITICSDGDISSNNWNINRDGSATFDKITCMGEAYFGLSGGNYWGFGTKNEDGTISNSVTFRSGTVGGWTLGGQTLTGGKLVLHKDGKIYSDTHTTFNSKKDGFYLGEEGLSIGKYFKTDKEGKITASEIKLSGEIDATGGSIGAFKIGINGLSYSSESGDKITKVTNDGLETTKLTMGYLAQLTFKRANQLGVAPQSYTFLEIIQGLDTVSGWHTSGRTTFTTADNKTVTVASNGVILSII